MSEDVKRWPEHRSGDRYGVFRVSETGDQRWSAAIARLSEGGPIAFDDIGFLLVPPDCVIVSPSWQYERPPTKQEAEAAFSRGEACLNLLAESDVLFAQLVRGRRVEMELLDDYGMGAMLVAEKRDGEIRLR